MIVWYDNSFFSTALCLIQTFRKEVGKRGSFIRYFTDINWSWMIKEKMEIVTYWDGRNKLKVQKYSSLFLGTFFWIKKSCCAHTCLSLFCTSTIIWLSWHLWPGDHVQWSTCTQYRILNPLFCWGALYSEVKVNNISVVLFWFFFVLLPLDPCSSLSPPCFTEEDRFSLEALRMIHKQMDDDKDGGIEVDESDEVGVKKLYLCIHEIFLILLFCIAALYLSALEYLLLFFLIQLFPQTNIEGKSNFCTCLKWDIFVHCSSLKEGFVWLCLKVATFVIGVRSRQRWKVQLAVRQWCNLLLHVMVSSLKIFMVKASLGYPIYLRSVAGTS